MFQAEPHAATAHFVFHFFEYKYIFWLAKTSRDLKKRRCFQCNKMTKNQSVLKEVVLYSQEGLHEQIFVNIITTKLGCNPI